jgi:uncharacterized iron-regulated protein
MRLLILFFTAILTMPATAQQPITSHFKIYDTKNQKLVTVDQIAIDMKDADVLFFGEEHNDSAGHWLENEIFQALHRAYGDGIALSMEMFETDCQLILDEYLDGHISEDRFRREARAWNNYRDYRPAVEYAKENRINVIAANPPRRYVNMVSRKGMRSLDSLPKASKKYLPPLPFDTATGAYREKFMGFMSGGSPGTENPRIFYSQNLWDAGMAHSIYQYWKKNKKKKIFHLVGKFHADEKLGTVEQLQKFRPGLKIKNISCFSDSSFADPDWAKFKSLGDYVILTDPSLKKTY